MGVVQELNPNAQFVFIGEVNSEVCANHSFHNSFRRIEDDKFDSVAANFQSWFGFYDRILLGQFNKQYKTHLS